MGRGPRRGQAVGHKAVWALEDEGGALRLLSQEHSGRVSPRLRGALGREGILHPVSGLGRGEEAAGRSCCPWSGLSSLLGS